MRKAHLGATISAYTLMVSSVVVAFTGRPLLAVLQLVMIVALLGFSYTDGLNVGQSKKEAESE